ncbi:MAG: DUF305 domain-containing protein [Nocardioidaceae bacterium]|nr:DUF305 domain-containing protein [Nocardioidaceae bacterium]
MRTTRTVGLAAALALVLGGTLAACGDDNAQNPTTSQASSTQHNDADITFATEMIPHHAQALTMVEMMGGRPVDPAVEKLAGDIRDAQTPEIETMTQWLTQWGEKVPQTGQDHGHNDMGGMGGMGDDQAAPGMMSDADMKELQQAPDAQFQDMWLEMMIKHHQGAIAMAKAEIENGQYQPAVDLAKQIVASQSEEISTMQDMLSN